VPVGQEPEPEASPTALEGLVLACEIRTSTDLPTSEALRQGAEVVRAILEMIRAFGGAARLVPQTGVIGCWELGDDHADAMVRAAAAAVRSRVSDGHRAVSDSQVNFGIGIAGAEGVQVDARLLAVRLSELASPGSALVSDTVYRLTRERFDYRGVGPVVPRSDPLPGSVFQLVGPKPERSGTHHVGAEPWPLVGRDEVLRALDACLDQGRSGRSAVVHLVGDPGAGKSKVLREWLAATERSGRFAGWVRLETHGVPYGGFPRRAWDRLVGPLTLKQTNASPRPRFEPEDLQRRLTAAGDPALLLVDDLHWIDGPSRDALAKLLHRVADFPALVVLAYRPSFAPLAPLETAGIHRRLRLTGLARPALGQLVELLAEKAGIQLSSARRDEIVARARGNPLYAQEAVAYLAESGQQSGERSPSLTTSLPELLIRRIEWTLEHALPELEQRQRHALLVEGMGCVSGAPRESLLRDLEVLEERLASWLDRFDVVEGQDQAVVQKFLGGLRSIDGRLALLNLLLGRQRPHRARLSQALTRLGSGGRDE
jgi:type II secretory pathway predicted ATPase ExeA